jgi:diacylglycerol kinase (ATP)
MPENQRQKLLFIINNGAGSNTTDWATLIANYFAELNFEIDFYLLKKTILKDKIFEKIKSFSPETVVAVGGDGTIKLVAEYLLEHKIRLGIIPAGSANGLAYELGIPKDPTQALDLIVKGFSKKIHVVLINNQLCIHLADVGLNAYGMKKFKTIPFRGMWGYFIAAMNVIWQNSPFEVELEIKKKSTRFSAIMVVIANGTSYGSGAIINPNGKLDDEFFEVVVVKKISIKEIFKMVVSHTDYDTEKTEVFQTNKLSIKSRKRVHFQIDGEYLGKIKEVEAKIVTESIEVIVPQPDL